MPQIQTIEGLHSLGQTSTDSQTFVMASQVSKDAYIATVERILKAAQENPELLVIAPEFPRITGGSTPCSVRGQEIVCRMKRQPISNIVAAIQEGPDPQYLDPARLRQVEASRFNEDNQVKAIFPILVSIEQQLPMSNTALFAIGVGVVAVIGLGWYLMKPARRPSLMDMIDEMGLSAAHRRPPRRRCVKFETRANGERVCVKFKKTPRNEGRDDLANRRSLRW